MKKTNEFPVVLVHGFLCFGDDQKLNDYFPNFGLWNGNACKTINDAGVPCFTPSVGPFSSVWDRCCDLYAKLKGGRVDYGKAHSEKYGHARYGRTYKALIPDWGTLDTAGKIRKISIVGHSFGGPTVRTFIELLADGSAEERACTPDNELSELFKGGKSSWIHACVTLAATHNGVTLPDAIRPMMSPAVSLVTTLSSTLGYTKFADLYDFHLDQFGLSAPNGKGKLIPFKAFKNHSKEKEHYAELVEDTILYELSIEGGLEITKKYHPRDNIYYFSHYGRRTWTLPIFKVEIPTSKMFFVFKLISPFEGFYKNTKDTSKPLIGKEWRPNDGIVNVLAANHPLNEPFTNFVSKEATKPGIWNVMPEEDKDHVSYMGIGETEEEYSKFFLDIVDRITDLPVI